MENDRYSNKNHLNVEDVCFVSRRFLVKLQNLILVDPVSKNEVNAANRNH